MNTANTSNEDEDAVSADAMEGGNRIKTFTLKDGDNLFRILGPFGPQAKEKQVPFVEIYLHWWRREGDKAGYPVRCAGKDSCPICDIVTNAQVELNKVMKPFTDSEGKVDKSRVPAALLNKQKWIKDVSWQRHVYYNAVNAAGEVGVLKIAKTPADLVNALIGKALNGKILSQKFNPCSRKDGVWFVISRTKGSNGKYTFAANIQKKTIKVEGNEAEMIVRGPLPEDIQSKLEGQMKDLFTIYKPQTAESLKEFLAKGPKDKFDPVDYVEDDDEESAPTEQSRVAAKAAVNDDMDMPQQDMSDDDVDALADAVGLKK